MNHDDLRLMIRRKLAEGLLPHDSIPRCRGGPAKGEEYDAYEEIIDGVDLVMEAISTRTNQSLQLHVKCFYIWDTERDAPARRRHGLP